MDVVIPEVTEMEKDVTPDQEEENKGEKRKEPPTQEPPAKKIQPSVTAAAGVNDNILKLMVRKRRKLNK